MGTVLTVAIPVVTAGISVVAIVVAVWGVRDQLQTATFLACTDRYAKVMGLLPFDARRPGSGYRLNTVSEQERTAVLGAFREYFNLCSEEMWLHMRRRIDKQTWKIWTLGMKDVARFPCFADAWRVLGPEYECFPRFKSFMQGVADEAASQNGLRDKASRRGSI